MEIIVSVLVGSVADPIKKYVVTPIKRHTSYAFTCNSNVKRLQDEVEQLQDKKVRLQKSVDAATRNGEEIYPNVTKCLSTVEKDIEEAEQLIQEKEDAKKKCFLGFCPNLKTHYQLSKKADKNVSVMANLLQDAQGLDPISFRAPLQPIVVDNKYGPDALPSRVLILDQILNALKDPNLNMIGLYGMGGVGKTTLAKELQGIALKEKFFETVVMVPVSQTPDLRKIQGEIAGFLNLQLNAEEILGRASELYQRLKKAKVLIILDNLWKNLDLNDVGIPSGDSCDGCKILLTSRRKHVLSNEMCTQKEFSLEVLEEEETWRLSEMSVSKAKDPDLRAIATEVAQKCAGLPLLIVKVATDLRNKDSYAWKDMLTQLSSLENTEIYGKVHKVIESSYEKLLDEEAKSLFLLCALFRNSNIRIHRLLVYSMGLGLFKHTDSIEGARNRVFTLIGKLKDECLLLDGDKAGFVKIHDVIHDIALAIASRVQHTFVGTSEVTSTQLQNEDCKRISLPFCDILELPEVLKCPKAEVFSLFMRYHSLDIPNSFFEGVTKLKIVDFAGVNFVSGLPSSLGFLTGLQTLCLESCELNNNVAIVAEMKQLEFLSFRDSNIVELPREIKALTRLKLLDLRGCGALQRIPENVLSNLSLLEELYMLDSFRGWEMEGNASLVELTSLSHLTTLEIEIRDDKLLPEDWFFNGLRNYKIYVGDRHDQYDANGTSRLLKLELKTSIGLMHRIQEFLRAGTEVLYVGEVKGIENLFYDCYRKLRFLNIRKCKTLKILFPFSSAKCLPQLQELEVEDCGNMEAIVGEVCEDEVMEFSQLTSLKLNSLPHLTGFCKTSITVSFPNLTTLKIILVTKIEEEVRIMNPIVFPQLDFLRLFSLPKMKRFCRGCPIEFSKLRELRINICNELKNFVSELSDRNNNESTDEYFFNELVTFHNLEMIHLELMENLRYLWHQQHFADNDSFSNLKSLEIEHCSKLSVVFPSNAYRKFRSLESLHVSHCHGVEEIYDFAS